MTFWSMVGVLLVLYIFWRFIKEIGNNLPVLTLLLLIAGVQWIIAPLISYQSSASHFKYFMYVDEQTYMSFVVPGFFVFTIALLWRKTNFTDFTIMNFSGYGKWILGIGLFADILSVLGPANLGFFLFLLSQFKFIGAAILLFSDKKQDRIFFYGAILYLAIASFANAMFHELLIWGIFLFMLWAIKNKPSTKFKLIILITSILFTLTIQIVKAPFREEVWRDYQGNKAALFLGILDQQLETGYLKDESNLQNINTRFNQGWIISAIMNYTPNHQPFAKGATFLEALYASIVPRFIDTGKREATGRINFIKYTGLDLGKNTAMALSIIGESYANFGRIGGILFMAFWGWFLSGCWKLIMRLIQNHPLLLFFVPLIFLQVIKAESEMLTVLNHLLKSSLLVFLFFWGSKKFLKWQV